MPSSSHRTGSLTLSEAGRSLVRTLGVELVGCKWGGDGPSPGPCGGRAQLPRHARTRFRAPRRKKNPRPTPPFQSSDYAPYIAHAADAYAAYEGGSGYGRAAGSPPRDAAAFGAPPPYPLPGPSDTAVAAAAVSDGAWAEAGFPVPGPAGWTQYLEAATGDPYYHNPLTGATAWERPPEWDGAAAEAGGGGGGGAGLARRLSAPTAAAAADAAAAALDIALAGASASLDRPSALSGGGGARAPSRLGGSGLDDGAALDASLASLTASLSLGDSSSDRAIATAAGPAGTPPRVARPPSARSPLAPGAGAGAGLGSYLP